MAKCPYCLKEITETDTRWLAAYEHAKEIQGYYGELPVVSGAFGFAMIGKALRSYENGERTPELLKELESTK